MQYLYEIYLIYILLPYLVYMVLFCFIWSYFALYGPIFIYIAYFALYCPICFIWPYLVYIALGGAINVDDNRLFSINVTKISHEIILNVYLSVASNVRYSAPRLRLLNTFENLSLHFPSISTDHSPP